MKPCIHFLHKHVWLMRYKASSKWDLLTFPRLGRMPGSLHDYPHHSFREQPSLLLSVRECFALLAPKLRSRRARNFRNSWTHIVKWNLLVIPRQVLFFAKIKKLLVNFYCGMHSTKLYNATACKMVRLDTPWLILWEHENWTDFIIAGKYVNLRILEKKCLNPARTRWKWSIISQIQRK